LASSLRGVVSLGEFAEGKRSAARPDYLQLRSRVSGDATRVHRGFAPSLTAQLRAQGGKQRIAHWPSSGGSGVFESLLGAIDDGSERAKD
jgi:hypothetical protein